MSHFDDSHCKIPDRKYGHVVHRDVVQRRFLETFTGSIRSSFTATNPTQTTVSVAGLKTTVFSDNSL